MAAGVLKKQLRQFRESDVVFIRGTGIQWVDRIFFICTGQLDGSEVYISFQMPPAFSAVERVADRYRSQFDCIIFRHIKLPAASRQLTHRQWIGFRGVGEKSGDDEKQGCKGEAHVLSPAEATIKKKGWAIRKLGGVSHGLKNFLYPVLQRDYCICAARSSGGRKLTRRDGQSLSQILPP